MQGSAEKDRASGGTVPERRGFLTGEVAGKEGKQKCAAAVGRESLRRRTLFPLGHDPLLQEMNASVISQASSSVNCLGGCFMK
jgi:hypothetical protein